jgi:hypothetical protein
MKGSLVDCLSFIFMPCMKSRSLYFSGKYIQYAVVLLKFTRILVKKKKSEIWDLAQWKNTCLRGPEFGLQSPAPKKRKEKKKKSKENSIALSAFL